MINRNLGEHQPLPTHRVFSADQPLEPADFFSTPLSLNNDGSTAGMNVNGSVTAQPFEVVCPANKVLIVKTLEWHLVDTGIGVTDFGGIVGALTNGCLLEVRDSDDTELVDLSDGRPITVNYEFNHVGGATLLIAPATDMMTVVLDFNTIYGYAMALTAGQYITFIVQDDLTAITHFECTAHGRLIDAP